MADSTAGPAGRIFISYRRDESAYPAGWLYDRLAQQYGGGQIFKDVDSIELGDDFVQVITGAVGSCDVLLALIGSQWLTVADERGRRRIDDPEDFVRLEIEAALTRDVRVIPILIDGAGMPRAEELPSSLVPLTRRQALELSPSRFEYDTGRLLRVLDSALTEARTASSSAGAGATHETDAPAPAAESTGAGTPADSPPARSRTRSRWVLIGIAVVLVVAGYLIIRIGLNRADSSQGNGVYSSLTDGATVEAPWRLVISSNGTTSCTIALTGGDAQETWSNPYPIWDAASFVWAHGGEFHWSIEPGCTVVTRPGAGTLDLPALVDGIGTSDAFPGSEKITVELEDIHGNQRCSLQLRDVDSGTILDVGVLTEQQTSVNLNAQGRAQVFLFNDACAVRVSPG